MNEQIGFKSTKRAIFYCLKFRLFNKICYERIMGLFHSGQFLKWYLRPQDDIWLLTEVLLTKLLLKKTIFVEIQDQHIGHLIESYIFFKVSDIKQIDDDKKFLLVGASSRSSNKYLANGLQADNRRLIKPGRLARKLLQKFLDKRLHSYHNCNTEFINYEYLHKNSELLKEIGASLAKDIHNIPEISNIPWVRSNRKICVVHIRCSGYYKMMFKDGERQDYGNTRNYDIREFKEQISYLLKHGYSVIRTGLFVTHSLDFGCKDYVELAQYPQNIAELLTILAFLRAELVITTGSGPDALCALNPDVVTGTMFCAHNIFLPYSIKQLVLPPLLFRNDRIVEPVDQATMPAIFTQQDLDSANLVIKKPAKVASTFVKELLAFSESRLLEFDKNKYHGARNMSVLYSSLSAKGNNMIDSPTCCIANSYINLFNID
jgi:putative glycosyltransferase (TIGR04372 family)